MTESDIVVASESVDSLRGNLIALLIVPMASLDEVSSDETICDNDDLLIRILILWWIN